MFGIRGRIVPLSADRAVSKGELDAFAGAVWLGDDGMVSQVTRDTRGKAAAPPGFEKASVVDVGSSLVFPGLIDLHNHLAYNTLSLWTEETRDKAKPFLHHNSWPGARSYAASVTWPAYTFITAAPQELLAYAETRAIVGGTTTIQGSPPKNRPRDGWVVRNVEDETWGTHDTNLIQASTLTLKPEGLLRKATRMREGSSFIYHCSEGQVGTVVAQEFRDAQKADCLQERFIAVHCNAIDPKEFTSWRKHGAVVWSPFSNMWLYGSTTNVLAAMEAGQTVCLGSDWGPSGTRSVLGELKVARLVSDDQKMGLSDSDLVRMVTTNPGDVLDRPWKRQVGRLQPGAVADVLVIRAGARVDPFRTLVNARERDVDLVVIGGRAQYGKPALMARAGSTATTSLTVDGETRAMVLTRPDDFGATWEWDDVIARMEVVRKNPMREIEKGRTKQEAAMASVYLARSRNGGGSVPLPPLRLALDMPTGLTPMGGLPKSLDEIKVPELAGLSHDSAFFESIVGRGYHGGVLDDLARFYR
ncbi:MAG TPA: amidohydrolase family protein [Dermatophilaceae bacterium]